MPNIFGEAIRFRVVTGKIVPPWWRVAYLLPPFFDRFKELQRDFEKVLSGKDVAFNRFVLTQVKNYVEKGVMPPANIAGAVLNMAEDVMAGREVTMRAGDYISLQNEMRRS